MSAQRMVNTKYWNDTYIEKLSPIEKLVFIYLLTNDRTNIAGVYEITPQKIQFDTGLDKDTLHNIFKKFVQDKKLIYVDGYIVMKNWIKNQTKNPSVKQGIIRIISETPKQVLNKATKKFGTEWLDTLGTAWVQAVDRVDTGCGQGVVLNLTKLNLTKPNGITEDELVSLVPNTLSNNKAFINIWREWINYRKELGKPLTKTAAKKQIKFLIEQGEPVEIIEQSMRNNWQGLFERTKLKKVNEYKDPY